jgi:hypothetical protein
MDGRTSLKILSLGCNSTPSSFFAVIGRVRLISDCQIGETILALYGTLLIETIRLFTLAFRVFRICRGGLLDAKGLAGTVLLWGELTQVNSCHIG